MAGLTFEKNVLIVQATRNRKNSTETLINVTKDQNVIICSEGSALTESVTPTLALVNEVENESD